MALTCCQWGWTRPRLPLGLSPSAASADGWELHAEVASSLHGLTDRSCHFVQVGTHHLLGVQFALAWFMARSAFLLPRLPSRFSRFGDLVQVGHDVEVWVKMGLEISPCSLRKVHPTISAASRTPAMLRAAGQCCWLLRWITCLSSCGHQALLVGGVDGEFARLGVSVARCGGGGTDFAGDVGDTRLFHFLRRSSTSSSALRRWFPPSRWRPQACRSRSLQMA